MYTQIDDNKLQTIKEARGAGTPKKLVIIYRSRGECSRVLTGNTQEILMEQLSQLVSPERPKPYGAQCWPLWKKNGYIRLANDDEQSLFGETEGYGLWVFDFDNYVERKKG